MSVSKELHSLHINWYLTMNGMGISVLDMNDPNFQLSGGPLVPILTIVLFGKDLDMAMLEYSNGFISSQINEVSFFLLRYIGKCTIQTSILYSNLLHNTEIIFEISEPPVLRSEPLPMTVVHGERFV